MDKQKFMKMYKHNKDCSCHGSKKENSATRPIGKSAKFFMWCAVFVTVATILSMFGVAGTYAKFVSRVSSGKRTIQAAGFLIQAGNGETSTTTREIVVAPGESETVTLPIKYFSQVDTEFLNPTATTTVTGNGILAESNWNNLLAEFATWKTTMGYSGDAPATLSDMFKVTFGNSGEDFALVLANALEAAGLSRITDNLVGRMSPSATASIDVSVNTRLEWVTTSDAFDTFMGFKFSHETVVPTVNVKYGVICQQFINAENTPVRAYVDGAIKATSTDAVGQTVSEFAATNATLPTSEQCCGWFTDAALTRPAEDDMIINSSTTLYTKTATLTGLTFTDIDETTCSVGGTSASGNVVIPRTHNGKLVTAVTKNGFKGNTVMTTCALPNSMQTLNDSAFREASAMTSCTLPNSITTMDARCFVLTKSLSGEIVIPIKVKSLGRSAFASTNSVSLQITKVTFPEGFETFTGVVDTTYNYLKGQQFQYCQQLKEVVLPSNFSGDLLGRQFAYCPNLTTINIQNVKNIEYMAFGACGKLENVGSLSSVEKIGMHAFNTCSSLKSVDLSSLTVLEQAGFANCTSLVDVYGINKLKTIGYSAFGKCTALQSISVKNVEVISKTAFNTCTALTSVSGLENVTTIGDGAFQLCAALTNVSGLKTLESIGWAAFADCTSLTKISLPSTLKYIGITAFQNTGLTSLNLPEGLLWIGDFAFNHCRKLQNATITIPSTVIQIGGREYVGANNENGILGTHVFYHTGIEDGGLADNPNYTGYLKSFSVAAGSTHFVTDEYGALYTADYKYLVAYPAGSDNTEFVMHEGCVDAFEMAFSRAYNLKSVTIANTFVIRDWNNIPDNFEWQTGEVDNQSDGLNLATYLYCGIEEFKVKADNPNYVSHDGILYKKVAGTADSYELIAVPPKKAVGAELVIWEKCTQVNGVCWYYATIPTKIKFKTGTVIAADVIKETGKLKNSENTAIPYEFY